MLQGANGKSNGYVHSDSLEDDDDGYPSLYVSSENSSTTDQLDSNNSLQASYSNSNRRVEACDPTNYSRPLQQNHVRRGRGYRIEPERQYEYSTNFTNDMKSGNIKVTVPNGSGRAKVVAFLLR